MDAWLESSCPEIAVPSCVLSVVLSAIARASNFDFSDWAAIHNKYADSSLTWHMIMSTVLPSTAQPGPSPSIREMQALRRLSGSAIAREVAANVVCGFCERLSGMSSKPASNKVNYYLQVPPLKYDLTI